MTEKSAASLISTYRKIDIMQHKGAERISAVMIQSWWRGVAARKKFRLIPGI